MREKEEGRVAREKRDEIRKVEEEDKEPETKWGHGVARFLLKCGH